MTLIDHFESTFRAAERNTFKLEEISIKHVLVIGDEHAGAGGEKIIKNIQACLEKRSNKTIQFNFIPVSEVSDLADLLKKIKVQQPDLLCTYRNLGSNTWQWPYSLGECVDVLTQIADAPVLLLPHPELNHSLKAKGFESVLALTDHLDGDANLVDYAVTFTNLDGTLSLVHIEDQVVFNRYMSTIAKIPEIDTDVASETLSKKLLDDAKHFSITCESEIAKAHPKLSVKHYVQFGSHLSTIKEIIADNAKDLLVLNTKDEDQLAMHGLAYPLAIEIRHIPLLLI